MKRYLIWPVVLSFVVITSCSMQKTARGPLDIVYVLSDEESQKVLKPVIDTLMAFGIRAPEFQPFYEVKWFPLTNLPGLKMYHNLIVIANLNTELGKALARRILPGDKYKMAFEDSLNLFFVQDFWVSEQVFFLIAGRDLSKVKESILANIGWIYKKIDENFATQEKKYIFKYGEQKNISRHLWEKYHWTMRIQHDYVLLREYPDRGFVWLGRGFPYRWVSVSWAEGFKPDWMTESGLYEKRNEIGKFYRDIRTDKRFLGYYWTKFGKWKALKMYGLWYHEKETKGGPFITYAFYDLSTDRTFVVDMLVFAPGEKVTILLRQVELMAKTLTTTYDPKILD